MKIAIAQTRPVKGDIAANLQQHKRLIALAIAQDAEVVVFPELSVTGYEPELAAELAITQDDARFDDLQDLSDAHQLTIGVGMPIKIAAGICIGMMLFRPQKPRQTYLKKYLYKDEAPFFIGGQDSQNLMGNDPRIALAICYELSVPQHAEDASESGATIYIASAVESVNGIDKVHKRLSDIARGYSMTVLLSNCIGQSGGYDCAGKSAIWNKKGALLAQLGEEQEGILMIDLQSEKTTAIALADTIPIS